MQRIEITQDFSLPVERVYAYLAEHENLGPLFGLKVTRVKDGDASRNGAGSVRQLRLAPLPAFQETVFEAVENEKILYRITKGSPLKGHRGELTFSPLTTGSRLVYVIEFDAAPGLAQIVRAGLQHNISKGLKTVDAKA